MIGRYSTQLASLELLQVLMPQSEKDLTWDLLPLEVRIMDEMTKFTSHASLHAMIHSTRDCSIVLWLLPIALKSVHSSHLDVVH